MITTANPLAVLALGPASSFFDVLPYLGAGGFGALIGWFIYYINRYRKADVQFSDIATLFGILGGGAVTTLFGATKDALFGAYGVGLFLGFFGYFITLIVLVRMSGGVFSPTWFLDGRRKDPVPGESIPGEPTRPPMVMQPLRSQVFAPPAAMPLMAPASPSQAPSPLPNAARIASACEDAWDANQDDCNSFVLAVASALGVAGLSGTANDITDTITSDAAWRQLADGVEAKTAADGGDFVLGGLRGSEQTPAATHGHVVVVVTGGLAQGKYPTAYWGSLGGTPEKNTTVNYAWRTADRDKVHYAARSLT